MGIFLLIVTTHAEAQRGHWGRGFGRGHVYGHAYFHGPRFYSHFSFGYGGYHRYRGGYYGYYRPYGYYHYRPWFPRFGVRLAVLPPFYYRLYVGPDPFYYYNGTFYSPYGNNEYTTVEPPLGARVPELPGDAKEVVIDGQRYYEFEGTYYQEEITSDNKKQYVVVGIHGELNTGKGNNSNANDEYSDRVGDRVSKLPPDCRAVRINGKKYYESPGGTYYEEIISPNKVEYEVVGKPD
jgi:hypothetical protein